MEFAGALRQAIQASGLTLERIRHRLGQRGLTVSVATLSYWQRGRSRPRSRAVVTTLEEILRVPAGTLTELLDDPAPAAVPAPGGTARGAPGRPGHAKGAAPGPYPGGERSRAAAELWPDPDRYARLVAQLDRSGDHRLERLSTHDVLVLGRDRRPRGLTVREVLRATGDDVDRVVCVHLAVVPEDPGSAPDPDPPAARGSGAALDPSAPFGLSGTLGPSTPLGPSAPAVPPLPAVPLGAGGAADAAGAADATGVTVDAVGTVEGAARASVELARTRYCRPGRIRTEGGLIGFELVFDRVLAAGDTAVVEYELRLPADGPVRRRFERRFPRPVRDYLAVVQFHDGMFPARCYGFSRESGSAAPVRAGELWIGTSGSAHLTVGDVRRGILGIEWEWE